MSEQENTKESGMDTQQDPSFADSVLQGLQETSLLSLQEDAGQGEEPSVSQEQSASVSKSPVAPEQPEQALLQV